VGPIVNDREMAAFDRPLREVGRRLVSAQPLRLQRVHPSDSVLGPFAAPDRGLNTTYKALIEAAFEERWWNANTIVVVHPQTGQISFAPKPARQLLPREFSMMEWNFSLFFGLAVQMYEATLVSDDAKLDRHFDRVNQGLPGLLSHDELEGKELFREAACADCHSGPELSSAVVRTTVTGFDNPDVFPIFQPPEQLERMPISSCEIAVYDQGFYNIGVRPTEEDLGLGALDPYGNPLSIAKLLTTDPQSIPSQELLTISYPSVMASGEVPPPEIGERTAVEGTFKIPSLRNVALTAPYFHNGGKRTLREVVEFYNRGGDFHEQNDAFIALGIGKLELTEEEIDKIVLFMLTFTDQRVVEQTAPFDHPELFVPNGHIGNENVVINLDGHAATQLLRIPEVGHEGGQLPAGFLEP
jgi:cytochrome c peroxidase